ncbi:MAG: hypothetical protein DRN12_02475 [Thermoplasmata archaeon]|nr:MAG: hypothetical protein DRN12_02475 [Thermoplasmata archaeon]
MYNCQCISSRGGGIMYNWRIIVRNGLPLLTITACMEIIAGQLLQVEETLLVSLPILLVSIPVINSIGGNLGSIVGARLASGLHIGSIEVSFRDPELRDNIIIALLMGFITYFILAIGIYLFSMFIGIEVRNISMIEFMSIIISVGFLLSCIVILVSVVTAVISFRRGIDPDDMVAPVVSTTGDLMGILFFLFLLQIFGVGI